MVRMTGLDIGPGIVFADVNKVYKVSLTSWSKIILYGLQPLSPSLESICWWQRVPVCTISSSDRSVALVWAPRDVLAPASYPMGPTAVHRKSQITIALLWPVFFFLYL